VIKSKIQTSPAGTYSGFLDAGRKIAAEGGVQALFRGFGPAMLRVSRVEMVSMIRLTCFFDEKAVPANAATFVGVEVAMKVMNNLF
jgi:solute carrier family 25 (mitochondrial carnitine/acylcarnitine transporter), member 20/29